MIRKFLDLSTAHLCPGTREWLDKQGVIAAAVRVAGDPIPAVALGSTAFGWFVYADEIPKLNLASGKVLLNRRHEMHNGYGNGPFQDGLLSQTIAKIDRQLVALAGDPDGIPADLHLCMAFARWEDCEYILFDADAPVMDGLPVYEDPEPVHRIASAVPASIN